MTQSMPICGRRKSKAKMVADKAHEPHRGMQAVKVGPYTVYLGGTMYFEAGDADCFDVLIPLTETGLPFGVMVAIDTADGVKHMPPLSAGKYYQVLPLPIIDFCGPPDNWVETLRDKVVPPLASGKKVVAFCAGSHGRTGTFLASLIALLEPDVADPIAAARERHCHHAVEMRVQAEAVFAARGETLPKHWCDVFAR